MKQQPWCVLVNPTAGSRPVSADEVAAELARAGVDGIVRTPSSVEDLKGTVEAESAGGQRNFVVVGGDGTAHHVVNTIFHAGNGRADGHTLAIVAAGSGSDYVRTFGHGRSLAAGIARLVNPDRYAVDIGVLEGAFGKVYVLNAVNIGIGAKAAAVASHLPRRAGAARYSLAFWVALARFPAAAVKVQIGRHTFEGDAINIVIANGQFFGGGMNVAPKATLTDGLFDVQVFAGPRRRAFSVMPRLVRGTHLTHTGVRRYIGSDVTISVPQDWPVEADGENLGTGSVTATTLPAALSFIA